MSTHKLSQIEQTAIVIIELHRRQHGRGPTYGWLTHELDLPRQDGVRLIRRLHRAGLLTSTRTPHSLATTHEGLRAALQARGTGR